MLEIYKEKNYFKSLLHFSVVILEILRWQPHPQRTLSLKRMGEMATMSLSNVLVKIVFKEMVTTSPINNITKMETTKSRQPRSPAYIARMNERIGKPFFEILLVRVGKPRPRRKHTL